MDDGPLKIQLAKIHVDEFLLTDYNIVHLKFCDAVYYMRSYFTIVAHLSGLSMYFVIKYYCGVLA